MDLDNAPRLVGRLWLRVRNRTEGAIFQYDESWLRIQSDLLWSLLFRSMRPRITLGNWEEAVWGNRGLGSGSLGASPDDARRG